MGKIIDIQGRRFGRLVALERTTDPRAIPTNRKGYWWVCLCDCGENKIIRGESLRNGSTESCGCMTKERIREAGRKKTPHPDGAFWRLYRRYTADAKEKVREFSLTAEEFKALTSSSCHYCGSPPRKSIEGRWSSSIYKYNGIDRKDNTIGYVIDNCLPCCYICNKSKHTASYKEFCLWLDDIAEFRRNVRNIR